MPPSSLADMIPNALASGLALGVVGLPLVGSPATHQQFQHAQEAVQALSEENRQLRFNRDKMESLMALKVRSGGQHRGRQLGGRPASY